MSVDLYMDVHVPYAITTGLWLRGVDVLTAQDDGSTRMSDRDLLSRVSTRRVLFSQDSDLLREAKRRQSSHELFSGVIFAPQLETTIGQCVEDLDLIARASKLNEWSNAVIFLPLR